MKIHLYLLFLVFSLPASCQTKGDVLICKGTASHAYHSHRCQGLSQCRAVVEKMSLDKAKSLGRKPCGYCYNSHAPSVKSQAPPQTLKSSSKTSSPGQCTAITRKGTRCSRSARSGGKCWQHGG